MKNFYTYIYHDPERNVPIYVGKGYGSRAYDHLKEVKKNSRFKNRMKVLKRHGLTPKIQFIPAETEELAFLIEVELIQLFGRKDQNKGTLYNMTDGGDGASGAIHSDETRKKRSASVKASYTPELRAARSIQFKGRVFSEETLVKMSLASSGRQRTEESKRKQGESISGEKHYAAKSWKLMSPDGEIFETKALRVFCEDRGLAYTAFRNKATSQNSVPIEKGLSKGWSLLI